MIRRLRNYMLRGILILVPAGVTYLLCWKLYEWLDKLILVYIHRLFALAGIPRFPLLDLAALIALLVLVGYFGGHFLGRLLIDGAQVIIRRVPLVRVIYATLQQIMEAVLKNERSAFSRVALVEYPRKGVFSIGFVTADTRGIVRETLDRESWTIFVPTTPNPTSGVLIFAPKNEVRILKLPVDQAAKLIMSAGVIDEEKPPPPNGELELGTMGRLFKKLRNPPGSKPA